MLRYVHEIKAKNSASFSHSISNDDILIYHANAATDPISNIYVIFSLLYACCGPDRYDMKNKMNIPIIIIKIEDCFVKERICPFTSSSPKIVETIYPDI